MSDVPAVTVIMRSKNSDCVIAQALAALYSQDFTDFELLVVDSGSKDRTLDIVRQYPYRLIQIEPKEYFPGAVLNMAIEQAHSELIVFQNSDAVPLEPQTLGRLVAAFDDPRTVAALARQIPRPDAVAWVRRDYAISFPPAEFTPSWITLSLPMAAMRKSAWLAHPFYTDAWASEDTEWGHWAREQRHEVRYVPDALVMHSHNYTLRQLYGRRFVEGEADAFVFKAKNSLAGVFGRFIASVSRDAAYHLAHLEWGEIPSIFLRRAVYHWAHFRGHQLGERRRLSGDSDKGKGQAVILSRYDP